MKTNIIKIAFLLFATISLSACKDALEEITTLDVDRAFSPTDLTAVVINKTSVRLSWEPVRNANSYTVEIYDNSTFTGNAIRTIEGITNLQLPYTVAGLQGATPFWVRIKALGENVEDSKYITATFTTEAEQIFADIVPAKLTSRSVTLNFPAGENATTLTINPGNISRSVTAQEISNGEIIISNLTPKVTYTVTLLLNNAIRGTKTFTTPAELPTGADVVYVAATDDLAAMIQAATSSTRFVILEGSKYNSDLTINIPAGIDISIIGEVATIKPIVSINQFMLPANGGRLRFENIELTGYANGDAGTPKRSYIINQNVASNMEEVSFDNCIIHHFVNSPLRLQSTNPITINKVIMNRCIVDDIGDNAGAGTYAVLHSNVATGKINNITITNSTFSNLGYGLILHNAAPSVSVTVDNNTFNNVIGDNRFFIDYNSQAISGGFSIKNNIIGKTLSPAGTAKGIRSSTTAPSVSNNYQTSDATISANGVSGILLYNGTSTSLFTNPATKNFKIKDEAFAGKSSSGDPRWRL